MDNPDAFVQQVFGAARDLPPDLRPAFLDSTCRVAPETRPRIEALLAAHDRLANPSLTLDPLTLDPLPPSTPQPFAPGTLLGRYRIVDRLGAGGMGVVFRARDQKLNRDVALKVLPPGVLVTPTARSHFRREALALARLNHPHIAALYDVGEQDDIDFLVMECVPGQSLHALLKAGPLSAADATRIALQVAGALEEAHQQGVVHRDLKPANVMLTPKGNAKVLDFGVARLLSGADTALLTQATGLVGTPLYMSPEQALGKPVDQRSDLWSLGALFYEMLTGRPPFVADSGVAVLRAIVADRFPPARQLQPGLPDGAEEIIRQALEKDPARRYPTAAAMAQDLSSVLTRMSLPPGAPAQPATRWLRFAAAALLVLLLAGAAAAVWFNRRAGQRRWAREDAIPQIESQLAARHPLVAFQVLDRAQQYLPADPGLRSLRDNNTQTVSISSQPSGAQVSIQDYLTPNGPALNLGTTPIDNKKIPKGYYRWSVSKAGTGKIVAAPPTRQAMSFNLERARTAPAGMVYVDGGSWATYNAFLGWIGPYNFPPYYIDQFEVSNKEYQAFVDRGGYLKPDYWPAAFTRDGHAVPWDQAMQTFRDATGRPGPATWTAGHYPAGQADLPVSGVSWYEAAAYAAFAGKALPVLGQWYQAAEFDDDEYTIQLSNLTGTGPAAEGVFQGLGPYGTYDLAGNVREWIANPVQGDLRFILGGSWMSPNYLYTSPEALSPFDRSEVNGFRCVRNVSPVPEAATQPVRRFARDFATYQPVGDQVFNAYRLLYTYPDSPLDARVEGTVRETEDWREEKITYNTAYNGERMSAYLFLPKRIRPPFQTILFFPSARVLFLPENSSELGDVNYFDYIIQSGRAVLYPIYEDTYERRNQHHLPGGDDNIDLIHQWYKDAARSLDYLDSRADIDSSRIAYLGVSMGAGDGVIISTLLEDRLRTAIFLDGGYFLQHSQPGADQADFAPRMKKPVLMVNGRYDYTFPLSTSQDPLFAMLGTPAEDKSHVVLDTPHDVTEQRPVLIKVVLNWLDRFLGPPSPLPGSAVSSPR